jgi:hypothetical protein
VASVFQVRAETIPIQSLEDALMGKPIVTKADARSESATAEFPYRLDHGLRWRSSQSSRDPDFTDSTSANRIELWIETGEKLYIDCGNIRIRPTEASTMLRLAI